MRMWMIPPELMCLTHIRGEHVEIHMFEGTLKKKKRIDGYIKSNAVQLLNLKQRHDELVQHWKTRVYPKKVNHKSECDPMINLNYLPEHQMNFKVDPYKAYYHLIKTSGKNQIGCVACRKRLYNYLNISPNETNHLQITYDAKHIRILVDNYEIIIGNQFEMVVNYV